MACLPPPQVKPGRFISWRNTGNQHCLATDGAAPRRFLGPMVLDASKAGFIPVVDILVSAARAPARAVLEAARAPARRGCVCPCQGTPCVPLPVLQHAALAAAACALLSPSAAPALPALLPTPAPAGRAPCCTAPCRRPRASPAPLRTSAPTPAPASSRPAPTACAALPQALPLAPAPSAALGRTITSQWPSAASWWGPPPRRRPAAAPAA